jgi:hypothetical protein
MKELKGIRKQRDMIIGAGTVQEVLLFMLKPLKR